MDSFSSRGGWIEVITGGMFSGKSEELIRRIRRAEIARQRTQIFKPLIDDRFELRRVISRDNRGLDALAVSNATDLRANIVFGVKVVGIRFSSLGSLELTCESAASLSFKFSVA